MLDLLDAPAVRRWCRVGVESLGRARDEINALNVFPVPDGDTGTNLHLTMAAALQALQREATADGVDDVGVTARAMAHGAFMGARGNSGVILSQLLRGMAEVLAAAPMCGGVQLREALERAADLCYQAVAEPVEGTLLTVARAAAEAAAETTSPDLADVARSAAEGARRALARTPEQLEVLRRAGVVDAGGQGLCVLLDALVAVVTGAPTAETSRSTAGAGGGPTGAASVGGPAPSAPAAKREPASPGGPEAAPAVTPSFEVMYLLDAPDERLPALRDTLSGLGDSLVVVGGDGLWNIHVHVEEPGAAIEAGVAAGRPHRIRVTHLDGAWPATGPGQASRRAIGRAVVCVAAGDGLAALLESVGATVVPGGVDRRPSTADVLAGISRAGVREVAVLPNDAASLGVAEAAAAEARRAGLRVSVIPTEASVQALAALAVHDPARSFDEDVVAMTSTAAATRSGEVTFAARAAVTMAGVCAEGDVLGLIDGEVALIGKDLVEASAGLLERMLRGGGELITLVTGKDAPPGLARTLLDRLRATRPEVDTVVYDGGQARYPLLVGVE